jgi:hypothetical protein
VSRQHLRTPENRVRSQHSLDYRGFSIDYHPDSWEFSYVPIRGAERVYLGAQFSVRAAIDRQLDGQEAVTARPPSSRRPPALAQAPSPRPVRTSRGSQVAQLLGGTDDGSVDARLFDGRVVPIRRVRTRLSPWTGALPDEFGLVPNKRPVDIEGVCGYPELAAVAALRSQGWDARWRKNFGGVGWWGGIGVDEALPPPADAVVSRITTRARELASARDLAHRGGGIWDIVAWHERKFLFVEVKGAEPFNANQLLWLEAALDLQVPASAFAVLRYTVGVGDP